MFLSVNSEDPAKSLQVDLKTVSRREPYRDACKTPGLITVSPNVGKEWVRPLWETPLTEVSDNMAEQLAVMYQVKSAAVSSSCSQNDIKRKRGRPPTSLILHEATETEQMMSTAQTIPKQIVQEVLPTLLEKGFYNIDVKSYSEQGFSFAADTDGSGDRTECPLCSCTHTSQLWFCIVSQWKGYQILTMRSYSSQCILTKLWHNKAFSDFHNLNEAAQSSITFQHVQWDEVPDLTLQPAGSVQMIVSGCGSKKSLRMRETIPHAAAMLGIPVEDVRVALITTRRAFADSKNDELIMKGHDFLHYLVGREEMTDIRTAKKLTIEIESSHLLQGGKPPHLLFLDKGETVAALWSSDTMK